MRRVYLDMVGCRLNQSELESFARQFRAAGYTIVDTPDQADWVVINTCTVTAAADADSRAKARQAFRAGAKQIALTGCWATLHPAEALSLPGVQRVIPNDQKESLVSQITEVYDLEPLEREPLPGLRHRTRAFLKVQDGCDNHCTFCVTRLARGKGRSRPIAAVLADIQAALGEGKDGADDAPPAREIVLSGVHLGSWGKDFSPPLHLRHLIQAILQDTDVPRLRLSSLEPWDLDEGFFRLWENPRLCRHLHLPLQSGCAATLRRMARKCSPEGYAHLVATARALIPGLAVTTDIIVGFPGEDENEFAQSLAFIQQMEFSGGHVFVFSPRPGTAATRLSQPVSPSIARARSQQVRESLSVSAQAFRQRFLGSTVKVLWESRRGQTPQGWILSGLSDNYLRVRTVTSQPLDNQISEVRLTAIAAEEMIGVVLS
ncbi:MAG: tRNA-t(6)A37 methylthiotransferase [Anaerolineae bacterium]|jgi:threonylcarbamoyladenosine tRNA methylthiotransferase MtaB|nr:MAG: tRNA-t(6)A37 methylthiotransferase [Anaerolineae bacterium]